MKKVYVINTGGTFSKLYNMIRGTLYVPSCTNFSVETIIHAAFKQNADIITIKNIIFKDSLDFTDYDRNFLLMTIAASGCDDIIVVHGTDTMDMSIDYLLKKNVLLDNNKTIVFTGAMQPFSIDPIEATANLSMAYGFIQADPKPDIYISMNGLIKHHARIFKDKQVGQFLYNNTESN